MEKKIMLMISCSGVKGEDEECAAICQQAELYGLTVIKQEISSSSDLEFSLTKDKPYDYIYLSAHGDTEGFGNNKGFDMSWYDFADLICNLNCLSKGAIIMLSCCHSGLSLVADTLFRTCDSISYVVGPRQSLESPQLHISFGIFLFNVEYRSIDPIVACEKIKMSTDIRFSCYDVEEWRSDENTRNIK